MNDDPFSETVKRHTLGRGENYTLTIIDNASQLHTTEQINSVYEALSNRTLLFVRLQ